MIKPAKKTKTETEPAVERDDEDVEELDADELGSILWGALGDDSPRVGRAF